MSKTSNVKAVLAKTVEVVRTIPGAFTYVKDGSGTDVGIIHSCPCGCGGLSGVYFPPSVSKVLWERSGTREAPTFRPSIGVHAHAPNQEKEPDGYHWHGYLTEGVWRSV